jgi:predicted nucleotidyltransferase
MTDPILERDPKLAEIVRRLVDAYQPERIYLFGSMARGDVGPDSDYDLLVIVPDEATAVRQDSDLAYRALRGTGIAADVLSGRAPASSAASTWSHRLRRPSCAREGCSMPHDPEHLAETRSWFLKGSRDLEAGAFGLTAPSPFTEDAVFHAQQAAEKALKGFLAWHGVPFRKTHSREELGAQCEAVDGELKPEQVRP